ncbi:curli-like amyloid fiber formation chaperone CsgH [Hymenobacter monticola]|uniref:Curli assembly protein CsgC n=1 Tax=Hymenobacter monticola TaxID=1705399 RepID=A0ABY4B7D4_9BACT|nr:curli-like amyloid fiber formation chaperone CsgH [Hymenobacter monticola]UOE35089.1 hypothetical protein MTP16_05435 [Hymenobacter monticola]
MFFILLLLSALQEPERPAPCKARLEMQQQDGLLTVVGHCRNMLSTSSKYRYELSFLREGKNGRSQNTQGGEFELGPQQDVSLSRTCVNASQQDSYRIHLRVLDLHGNVVAQDSVFQHSTPANSK